MFGFYLPSPERLKQIEERKAKEAERRCSKSVLFTPKMKWEKELNLNGTSWPEYKLFISYSTPSLLMLERKCF